MDVDGAHFVGTMDPPLLLKRLSAKISDPRFRRYLARMVKSGVLVEGDRRVSDEGVPPGSNCRPMLATILAHWVSDTGLEETVKPPCAGRVALVRYGADLVIGCQYEQDAARIHKARAGRLSWVSPHAKRGENQARPVLQARPTGRPLGRGLRLSWGYVLVGAVATRGGSAESENQRRAVAQETQAGQGLGTGQAKPAAAPRALGDSLCQATGPHP
jgi:hypothetical protein